MLSPTTPERWSLFPDPAAPLTAMPAPEVISVPLPALPSSGAPPAAVLQGARQRRWSWSWP
jgi:hypothetical protein